MNQHAFPYGGIELCRLYDGDQRVVSNVGGRPWASFGVLVRDERQGDRCARSGPRVLRDRRARRSTLLTLAAGPVRPRAAVSDAPLRGPVRDADRARAARSRSRSVVETTHRFTRRRTIETRWAIAPPQARRATRSTCCSRPGARRRGRGGAARRPAGHAGRAAAQAARKVAAAQRRLLLPRRARRRATSSCRSATARARRRTSSSPRAQSSAPRPGPTLAVQLAHGRRFRRLGLGVRIAPAADRLEAARVARRLRRTRRSRQRRKRS